MIVYRNYMYIIIDHKKIVILLSKTIFLIVRNALLRFLRIWNQDRRAYTLSLYEPTQ